jgi:hypothetical protein
MRRVPQARGDEGRLGIAGDLEVMRQVAHTEDHLFRGAEGGVAAVEIGLVVFHRGQGSGSGNGQGTSRKAKGKRDGRNSDGRELGVGSNGWSAGSGEAGAGGAQRLWEHVGVFDGRGEGTLAGAMRRAKSKKA